MLKIITHNLALSKDCFHQILRPFPVGVILFKENKSHKILPHCAAGTTAPRFLSNNQRQMDPVDNTTEPELKPISARKLPGSKNLIIRSGIASENVGSTQLFGTSGEYNRVTSVPSAQPTITPRVSEPMATGPPSSSIRTSRPDRKPALPIDLLEHVTKIVRDNPTLVVNSGDMPDVMENVTENEMENLMENVMDDMNSITQDSECMDTLAIADDEVLSEKLYNEDEGQSKKQRKKSKAKIRKKRKREDGQTQEGKEEEMSKKSKAPRPNYFVALKITNPKIHAGVQTVQESVREQEPRLSAAIVPLPTLHITLRVFHLGSDEDITRASGYLDAVAMALRREARMSSEFRVGHIASFNHNVVFAKVQSGPGLRQLGRIADIVNECFTDLHGDDKSFTPHITIMKLSKAPHLRKKGIRKIDPKYYKEFEESYFGTQKISTLQLCSMMKRKQENGYYHVEHEVPIGGEDGLTFQTEMERTLEWNFQMPEDHRVESAHSTLERTGDNISEKNDTLCNQPKVPK